MKPTTPLRCKFSELATTPRPWLISFSLDGNLCFIEIGEVFAWRSRSETIGSREEIVETHYSGVAVCINVDGASHRSTSVHRSRNSRCSERKVESQGFPLEASW